MKFKPGDVVRYEPSVGDIDKSLDPRRPAAPLPLEAGIVVIPANAFENQDDRLKWATWVVFPPDTTAWMVRDEDLVLLADREEP